MASKTSATKVTLLTSHKEVRADVNICLSAQGCVLFGDKKKKCLNMLAFNGKASCYQQVWSHSFPPLAADVDKDGIAEASVNKTYSASDPKCILSDGMVALSTEEGEGEKTTTAMTVYDQSLKKYSFHLGPYGRLLAPLPGMRVAYERYLNMTWWNHLKADEPHCIAVCNVKDHKDLLVLKPPWPHAWSDKLSIWGHPSSGGLAVVDSVKKVLDIFQEGEHKHRQSLDFTPAQMQAVTANKTQVFVLKEGVPPVIHVYNWEGAEKGTMTHDQLKLKADDWIIAIGVAGDTTLQLAAAKGPLDDVSAVNAYKV